MTTHTRLGAASHPPTTDEMEVRDDDLSDDLSLGLSDGRSDDVSDSPPFPLPSHPSPPASFTHLPSRFLQSVHLLHRAAVSAKGSPAPRLDLPDEVAMQTHQAATVVFPDRCDGDCVCLRSDCV